MSIRLMVKWVLPGVVALCLLVFLAARPLTVSTVRLPRKGNDLFAAEQTATGGTIRLHYRHSVEKTEVEGRFRVGAGPVLQAVETRMTSTGTGLPNTDPQETRREGKWIVKDEGLKEIGSFDFFLSPVNSPQLLIDGSRVPLESLVPGSVIRLDVEKAAWGRWLLWRYFKIDWPRNQP